MTEGKLQVGQIVCSKAGRDKDCYYIIYSVLDDKNVQVIDGTSRKIDNLKRKNIKHLRAEDKFAIDIAEKLKLGEKITNAEVKRSLKALGLDNLRNARNT